jgi:cytochrome c-type biogenesis protein CcmH
MSAFWSIVAAMLVAVVGLLAAALLRRRNLRELDRNQQNVRIARERLAELEAEHQRGELSDETFDQEKLELEQTLLSDLDGSGSGAVHGSPLPGRLTTGGLLVLVPLVAIGLYLALGAPQYMDKSGPGAGADEPPMLAHSGEGLPPIEELVGKLEDKLKSNPNDPGGWYLLGRTYSTMHRYADAVKAYEKVLSLVGDNPKVMVALADSLAMSQNGDMAGRPAELVAKVLKQTPSDTTALWLAGMAAEQSGNLDQALDYWKKLYPLLASDAESQKEVRTMMEAVQTKLGRPVSDLKLAEAAPAAMSPGPGTPASAGGRSITVKVSLDQSLSGSVSPSETLFVFARAVSGPPMPLAVARKKVSDLPLTVTLDDSMAMMPAMRLSNFDQVSVTARISKSGQPMASSGDLQSDPVTVGRDQSGPLALVISQAVP